MFAYAAFPMRAATRSVVAFREVKFLPRGSRQAWIPTRMSTGVPYKPSARTKPGVVLTRTFNHQSCTSFLATPCRLVLEEALRCEPLPASHKAMSLISTLPMCSASTWVRTCSRHGAKAWVVPQICLTISRPGTTIFSSTTCTAKDSLSPQLRCSIRNTNCFYSIKDSSSNNNNTLASTTTTALTRRILRR